MYFSLVQSVTSTLISSKVHLTVFPTDIYQTSILDCLPPNKPPKKLCRRKLCSKKTDGHWKEQSKRLKTNYQNIMPSQSIFAQLSADLTVGNF
jgi:hypothetical protein